MTIPLFVQIPKTGGTSIRKAITESLPDDAPHSEKPWLKGSYRWVHPEGSRAIFPGHIHLPSLIEDGLLTQAEVDACFKFSIVRNPWDRLVSLFGAYRQSLRLSVRLRKIGFDEPKKTTFCQFVDRLSTIPIPPPSRCSTSGMNEAGPQLGWLRDGDGNPLDLTIYRFENLGDAWRDISDRCGYKWRPLPHENATRVRKPYQDYYSGNARSIVARMYAEEIEMFDYRF